MKALTLSAFAALMATLALADVQARTVTFDTEGVTLSGTLYLPADHDGAKLPTVVLTGAWTSVEEQMPRGYAEEMVERGFAAFTLDFRDWGKSGDLPQALRFKEDPQAKISDLKAAFEAVASLPEVVIDYKSLWGGEPATMTPAELMTAWRGIVPGFDATWHEVSEVPATVTGDTATATAFVDGRHWIGDRLWRPVGACRWDLARIDGDWKVARMEFAMTEESGDRALATEAMERARALAPRPDAGPGEASGPCLPSTPDPGMTLATWATANGTGNRVERGGDRRPERLTRPSPPRSHAQPW